MKYIAFAAAAALLAATCSQATAQQPAGGQGQSGVQLDTKSLVGSTVRGKDGKDIGKVDNVMIDPKDGKVTSLMISMGGTLGVGGKQMSVPWDGVQIARDQQKMIVTLNEELVPKAQSESKSENSPSASPSSEKPKQ